MAREAVTTETPIRHAISRALGTFAPSLPTISDSMARAISRYFGNDAEDIDPPNHSYCTELQAPSIQSNRDPICSRNKERRKLYSTDFARVRAKNACLLACERYNRHEIDGQFSPIFHLHIWNAATISRLQGDELYIQFAVRRFLIIGNQETC